MPVGRRDGGEAGINYKCYKTTTRWYFSGYDFPPKNNQNLFEMQHNLAWLPTQISNLKVDVT